MKTKNSIAAQSLCFLVLLLLVSCHSKLDDAAFVKYVNNPKNGAHKILEIGEWTYDIQYKPSRYIWIQEHLNTPEQLTQRKKQLENTLWFNISIKHTEDAINPLKYHVSGIEEYNARLDYFLNVAVQELSLHVGNTSIKPMSYLFENNYSLTPNETMIVGFECDHELSNKEDLVLKYKDILFKNGIIQAHFDHKDINHLNIL